MICQCGCGQQTRISNGGTTNAPRGEYARFVQGHNMRGRPTKFYRSRDGRLIHRARAEKALGKPLPPKAIVHHADGSKNEHAQLVICENQAYHGLLHVRMRVKARGGNPNTDRICVYCKEVKPISDFVRMFSKPNVWHCKECSAEGKRRIAARKRLAA